MKKTMRLALAAALLCLYSGAFAQVDVQTYYNPDGSVNSAKVRRAILDGAVDPVDLVKSLVTHTPEQAAAIVAAAVGAAPDRKDAIVAAAKAAAPDQAAAIDGAAENPWPLPGGRSAMNLEDAVGDQTDPTTFKKLSPSQ